MDKDALKCHTSRFYFNFLDQVQVIQVIVLFLQELFTQSYAVSWKYPSRDFGPPVEAWGGLCDMGITQSPIDLYKYEPYKGYYHPFEFENYGQRLKDSIIKNNGHTVQIDAPSQKQYKIKGGGLPGIYVFEQMHWHWSSEHTINRKRYPLEIHLVHRNQKYQNLGEASKHEGGIAVLGILFHQADTANKPLASVVANLNKIGNSAGQSVEFYNDLRPKDFIPDDVQHFYRYQGSLTTPKCNEGVIWTVFAKSIPVTLSQVEYFAGVRDGAGAYLKHNYRSLQSRNNRIVTYVSTKDYRSDLKNGASTIVVSIIGFLPLVLYKFLVM